MLLMEQTPHGIKHVVIVGGGFAGLNCARKLAANPNVRITLLDKNNYHQFQPLLYQVATGVLAPDNIAFNLRFTLHHPNVDVKMTEVISVDLNTRVVETAQGQRYQGDFLVLAAGSQPNFFSTTGAEENSYPLYSLHDAERLRSRILAMLETAERDPSVVAKGALNFVIVGGGPTGAEMAGAFGDMLQLALKTNSHDRAFKDLPADHVQIFLVDGGHAVLSAFSPASQEYAGKMLEERAVQLRLHTRVKEIGAGHVLLSDGTHIPTHTVIWAGGLKAASLSNDLGVPTGSGGRLDVAADLTVPGLTAVYALGDFANITGKDGSPLPQLASVAEQSGKCCAKNILLEIAGKPGVPFHYLDKGIMAIIGRNSGVAEVGEHRLQIHGAIAFAAWLGVHAALLSSTRAKMEAFMEWAWDYFGGARSDAVLDRKEELQIDWNADGDSPSPETPQAAEQPEAKHS